MVVGSKGWEEVIVVVAMEDVVFEPVGVMMTKEKVVVVAEADTYQLAQCCLTHTEKTKNACHVCNQLSAEGDAANHFDEHTHNLPSGYTRFAAMTQSQRWEIIKKLKMCTSCLDR